MILVEINVQLYTQTCDLRVYTIAMSFSPNFSNNPGCWEQQLIRRYNNPLFPESLRNVVHQQVVEAREKDKAEQQTFHKRFEAAVKEVSELPEKAEAEQLLELIPKLTACYNDCMTLCIDLPKEKQALARLITLFEETLLKSAGEESAFGEQVARDKAERKIHQEVLENRIIASMMRENSPVSVEELPATLLSAEPEQIGGLLPFLDSAQLGSLTQQCRALVSQHSTKIPDAEKILELIENEFEKTEK